MEIIGSILLLLIIFLAATTWWSPLSGACGCPVHIAHFGAFVSVRLQPSLRSFVLGAHAVFSDQQAEQVSATAYRP